MPDGNAEEESSGEAAAREICLRLLTAAPRTRAQLAAALRRRRIREEAAAAVLDRLAETGLIDDAAFAAAWVESRHHGRGLSRRALSAELRERGVASDQVRAAVAAIGPEDEREAARRLVASRAALTRGRPMPARVRQLVGVLARKGYSPGLAYQVVREALAQERWADDEPDLGELAEFPDLTADGDGDDGPPAGA